MPEEHIQCVSEIISYAEVSLGKKLNEYIYITLTDHLNFAIERQKKGILFPGIDGEMRFAITVLSAMPSMSSVAMLAEAQNSEGKYSACEVFFTTVCCIVTLPLLCLIISK